MMRPAKLDPRRSFLVLRTGETLLDAVARDVRDRHLAGNHRFCTEDCDPDSGFTGTGTFDQVAGAHLRSLRIRRGVTLTSLAQTVGLSKSSLSTIETGRHRLHLHTFVLACSALGSSPHVVLRDILTRIGPPQADVLPPGPRRDIQEIRRDLNTTHQALGKLLRTINESETNGSP